MKQYIQYTRKKINNFCYKDPNTDNRVEKETGGITKFNETSYEFEGICLGYVEYPDETKVQEIEYFINLDSDFNFKFITEEEANILLKNIDELISVKDFKFYDKRPVDFI